MAIPSITSYDVCLVTNEGTFEDKFRIPKSNLEKYAPELAQQFATENQPIDIKFSQDQLKVARTAMKFLETTKVKPDYKYAIHALLSSVHFPIPTLRHYATNQLLKDCNHEVLEAAIRVHEPQLIATCYHKLHQNSPFLLEAQENRLAIHITKSQPKGIEKIISNLHVDDVYLEDISDLKEIATCQIKGLSIKNCKINYQIITEFENLEKLEFINCDITEEELAIILLHFRDLQTLSLENNQIDEEGTKILAPIFKALLSLKTLNLSKNKLGPAGVDNLLQTLENHPTLELLDLSKNNCGDQGVFSIEKIINSHLKQLFLCDNNITTLGQKCILDAVCQATHFNFQKIDLQGNPITKGMLRQLNILAKAKSKNFDFQ